MPAERAPMRKVREVLRLRHALGVSERQIAVAIGVSRSTVSEYLRRATVIGITWPVPEGMDDTELERRLFTPPTLEEKPARPLPDWTVVHRELKRRSVTLLLLWEEYRAEQADAYAYSRFCDLYRQWCNTISPTMRQTHGPAEKLFVDFAGDTVAVFDADTGTQRLAHLFVAVLGASNYTFAEARWSEGLPDWIGVHVNAFTAIGGVPKAIVCDNLKAGVTATCRYEPGVNRTYQELAEHYDTAILPTRVRKPRDKAKVEVAVQIVQRFVLARLRNRRFFSLHELNAAIREAVADVNAKIMRELGVSRDELFAELCHAFLTFVRLEQEVAVNDHANRKTWADRQRGLDVEVALNNPLSGLIQGIAGSPTECCNDIAIAAGTGGSSEFAADAQQCR